MAAVAALLRATSAADAAPSLSITGGGRRHVPAPSSAPVERPPRAATRFVPDEPRARLPRSTAAPSEDRAEFHRPERRHFSIGRAGVSSDVINGRDALDRELGRMAVPRDPDGRPVRYRPSGELLMEREVGTFARS